MAWTGAASWAAQMLSWLATLLVVRLLNPDDYGIVALAALYLRLATMLSEFGIGTAVITLRDLPTRLVAQLNTVALLIAMAALLIAWLLAIPLASVMESPRLVTLVRVMSIGLVVASISSVPTALLQKAFRFRFLAAAQIAQSVVGSAGTLLLALFGAGYWSLALGPLVGQLTISVMVVIGAPTGYQWPDWPALNPALRFSRTIILERLCWFLYSGSDRFLIGKWIGEAGVGLYSVASSLGMMAVEKVASQVLRVAPAAFAEVQKDPALLRRYLLSMTEGLSIVAFPISIGISLTAGDLIRVLFGEQWVGAITPLRILALFAAYQSVTMPISRVFAAIGDIRFLMHVGMATLTILPLSFMVGTHWGLAGVAAVWVLIYPITQLPLLLRLFRRIHLTWGQYLRALWPGVNASLLMGLAIWLLRQWAPVAGLPYTARLALRICVGATVYTLAILIFHAERIRIFKNLIDEYRARNESDQDSSDSSDDSNDQRPRLIS